MTIPIHADAVVFDCDGLLVDTETCGTRESAGAAMADYFGRPGEGAARARRLHDLVAEELSAGADPLPGARDLVVALGDRVPIAVASNSPRVFVDAALDTAGLTDLFKHVYAADDVEHAKPAPDLYLAACAGLGADPARSVAFEDSRAGVTSATAAGMFVVGVPSLPGVVLEVHEPFAALPAPVQTA